MHTQNQYQNIWMQFKTALYLALTNFKVLQILSLRLFNKSQIGDVGMLVPHAFPRWLYFIQARTGDIG